MAVGWLSVVLIIDDVGELMWHSKLNIITPTFSHSRASIMSQGKIAW